MNTIPEKWTVLFHLNRNLLDMPLIFGLGSQKMVLRTGLAQSIPTSAVSSTDKGILVDPGGWSTQLRDRRPYQP
jgi:hypothetical protein